MARSISPLTEDTGLCREDLEPRRHMTAERSSKKLSLHLSQFMVLLYAFWCLSAIIDASLLYTTLAVAPIPPAVEKTRGENEPCSISRILSSYALLFSSSFPLCESGVAVARCERVENPNIKKCTLPITTPETLCYNVEAGSIFSIC